MGSEPKSTPGFTRETALLLASHRPPEAARAFFDAVGSRLTTLVARRFAGFGRALLTRNPENYGLYFVHDRARVPFLWLGMAWSNDDPPGTLPSWGASLEVDGAEVGPFKDNLGGLWDACQAVTANSPGQIRLYPFPRHVELACWRSFDWLLGEDDQPGAMTAFWESYLKALSAGGIPEAAAAFIRSIYPEDRI